MSEIGYFAVDVGRKISQIGIMHGQNVQLLIGISTGKFINFATKHTRKMFQHRGSLSVAVQLGTGTSVNSGRSERVHDY